MASSYVNDLRLNELATGDASGTWGDTTNTNLELIAEAFSYGTEGITTNADTHTTTIADGATDPGRSMYLEYTGTLDSTCTITIAPNTVSKLWIIENGTSGSQSIIIKQGSGATVTIPSGKTKVIYADGAGSGGKMVDAFASLTLQTSGIIETSASIQTALIEFTDGDDAMTIADGGAVTFPQAAVFTSGASFNDVNITNVGSISLDSIVGDGDADTSITFSGSNVITVKANNANQVTFADGAFSPVTDSDIDLGTSSLYFKNTFFDTVTTTGAVAVGGTINGVGIISNITNFSNGILISNDGGTGTLNAASYNTGLGWEVFDDLTTGDENTSAGYLASTKLTTGGGNSAFGYQALATNTTGNHNTAIGRNALNLNTTAAANTAIGFAALEANTTGASNVAVGFQALDANTTASNNTAVGVNSLGANTTGAQNTAVGQGAGQTNTTGVSNSALGREALKANTTGDNNTATGQRALFNNTTADNNTAVGHSALNANTTGANNTAVGALAGDATDDGAGNTAIGYAALSANCGDGNTGVGLSAGTAITGADNTCLGANAGLAITSGGNNLVLGHDAARSGSPGGNQTSGSNRVFIGDENIADAFIQVDWTVASDQRDKTDFTALDLGLDFVKALAPVTYKWDKRSKYGDKTADGYDLASQSPDGTHKEDWLDIGFKAQEVEALEIAAGYNKSSKTNLVSSHTDDGKQIGLQYSKFVPILVKAIQEQNALIESLTARITTLEG